LTAHRAEMLAESANLQHDESEREGARRKTLDLTAERKKCADLNKLVESRMKFVIFHASDIHLSTENRADNPVLHRVPEMVAAIRALFLNPKDVTGCLLLVTGDVAFAGLKAEYDLALRFFRDLQDELNGLYPEAVHRTIFIPGNHDCKIAILRTMIRPVRS
jgi:hypothetical protein